ncbi:MAG TPA: hypothetical protein VFA18_16730 [Gemmataceae bacterium]|nr:hypothetical protein [Gemmataceae bacterium]
MVDHLQGYRALAGVGLALLAGSWVGYVLAAGPHYQLTLLSSIPFLVLFVLRLTHLVLLKPRPDLAARGTAPA